MVRLAPNLYRLVGTPPDAKGGTEATADAAQAQAQAAVAHADIVQVPIPPSSYVPPKPTGDDNTASNSDDNNTSNNNTNTNTNSTNNSNIDLRRSLTVAFLPPNTRMDSDELSAPLRTKAAHPAYVGC